jgi:putative spermidine/putrescine transport system ATP-binding protein
MAYLELAKLRKSWGAHLAVEGFDLEVAEGEFISFLGGSGCGKTTTLRMVAGFETPDSGELTLAGEDITRKAPNRRNVGMVFQNYALFPNLTVAQNVAFGLKVRRVPRNQIGSRVGELLGLVHLSDFGGRYPHQLSGGQQQRVALARALAPRPRVLLLDEPLSALDARIRQHLRTEIRALQKTMGITTIYVTHDQEEALSLSDRIVVMDKGRIEQVGTPSEIYHEPATAHVASFVGHLGSIEGEGAPDGRFLVAGQTLTPPRPLIPGAKAKWSLRPERVVLDPVGGEWERLSGVVQSVAFLGSVVRTAVTLGDQTLWSDTLVDPRRAQPQVGAKVTVGFARDSGWVE